MLAVLRGEGDALRVHGLLQHLHQRIEVGLAKLALGVGVFHVGALVLARSARHHAQRIGQLRLKTDFMSNASQAAIQIASCAET